MASAEQIKALIRCHADGDDERFYAIALQVAAQEARKGHGKLAVDLKESVDSARSKKRILEVAPGPRPLPPGQPRGELADLLAVEYPKTRLSQMALCDESRASIERVLLEQRQAERLRGHGLAPTWKLLLVGPPGTGKTMTASALAGELGIPLFIIQLDSLITKFLGETAAKLRMVFEAVRNTRVVYLFDEFDAIASERANKNDVGEIRRVLNSFLKFLELEDSNSLVVGASNHPALLDKAIFRRFDVVIEYQLPSFSVAMEVMRSRLAYMDTESMNWESAAKAAEGLSHAEITRACDHAAKDAILEERRSIGEKELIWAFRQRRTAVSFA